MVRSQAILEYGQRVSHQWLCLSQAVGVTQERAQCEAGNSGFRMIGTITLFIDSKGATH